MIIKVGGGLEPLGPIGVYAYENANQVFGLYKSLFTEKSVAAQKHST